MQIDNFSPDDYLKMLQERPKDYVMSASIFELNEVIFAIETQVAYLHVQSKHDENVANQEVQQRTEKVLKITQVLRQMLLTIQDWEKMEDE